MFLALEMLFLRKSLTRISENNVTWGGGGREEEGETLNMKRGRRILLLLFIAAASNTDSFAFSTLCM